MTPPLTESELLECACHLLDKKEDDVSLVKQLQAMPWFKNIMLTNLVLLGIASNTDDVIQGIMATWLQIGMEIGRRRAEARALEEMVGL